MGEQHRYTDTLWIGLISFNRLVRLRICNLVGFAQLVASSFSLMSVLDRTSLSVKSTAHSVLTSLGHSLARYMGLTSDETGFAKWGIESSAQLVDLLSKVRP